MPHHWGPDPAAFGSGMGAMDTGGMASPPQDDSPLAAASRAAAATELAKQAAAYKPVPSLSELARAGALEPAHPTETLRETIERAYDQADMSPSSPSHGSSHETPPSSWPEAVISVAWVILDLGYGLEFCAASVRGEWERAGVSFLAMVILTAGIVHRKKLKAWMARTSPNWVFAAFSVLLLAVALSPYVEQRRFPFAGWLTASHSLDWNGPELYDGRPIGWNWPAAGLGLQLGNQTEPVRVLNFTVMAKNFGPSEAILKTADFVSLLDASRLPMKINSTLNLEDIAPVPVGAEFTLNVTFNGPKGPPTEQEFLREWATFYVLVQYEGQPSVRHDFTRQEIQIQLDRVHPELLPHVSRKRQ